MRNGVAGCLLALIFVGALAAQSEILDLVLDPPAGKQPRRAFQSLNDFPPGITPVRSRLIELNLAAIDPNQPDTGRRRRRVRLNLFPDVDVEVTETRARGNGRRGRFSWSGKPEGNAEGDVVFSVVDGRVSASIALRQGFFQVRPAADGTHELTELVSSRLPVGNDAISPPASQLAAAGLAKLSEDPARVAAAGDPVIDMLVVYTPEARRKAGGSQRIQDKIALAIAEANSSFANSVIALELRLAGMAEVPVSGPQTATSSFLQDVTFNNASIASLRDRFGADMVSVWIDRTSGGYIGIAWVNPGPGVNFSSHTYGVSDVSFATGPSYTFSHETGHNLGATHDRDNAGGQGAFPYSYGYQYNPSPGQGFYTIMAYSSGCFGCSGINYWSNPNVSFGGVPTGVPSHLPNSADNALTLNQIGPPYVAYRPTSTLPPNNPPTASNQALNVAASVAAPIALGASDADGNPITFEILTQPLHGDLSGSGGSWTYTADAGYTGPDGFQFHARDDFGGFDIGTVTLNVQLPSVVPPVVSLAQPAGGPFTAPANINLVATATDADGSVDRVDFFADGQQIGTANSADSTFTYAWTNVAARTYSVVARAFDNLGASSDSSPVSVTVQPGGGGGGYTARAAQLFYAFDEGSGSTVFDQVGSNDGAIGGSASWTGLGLQGGYVNSGVNSFGSNKLSAVSGDAYTVVWVGKLDFGSTYQTLFSMRDGSAVNVDLRYYHPNGYLYLKVNGNVSAVYAGSLLNKVIMVTLRCSGGACSWRVGGSSQPWMNVNPGSKVAAAPLLQVGADFYRWAPLVNSASALFWVYNDDLTDSEVNANFDYAGSVVNARGAALEGYTSGGPNSLPSVSVASPSGGPFTAPASINLTGTAGDSDGSIDRVELYANGALIGADTSVTSSFSFNWTGVAAGSYSVVARAFDNLGGSRSSSPVNVTVGSSGGPSSYTARAAQLFYAFDEGSGSTVFDQVGSNDGIVGGSASWTSLGLQGGYVNSGVNSFGSNKLSAVSGDAYTVVWVGKLDFGSTYQTLFSMRDGSAVNVDLRYYHPNGYLYLKVNGNVSAVYAGSLLNKVIMVTLRCSGGACSWRVGGSSQPWMNVNPGSKVAAAPLLQVGADFYRWTPLVNSASALFWVYNDDLTDSEVNANFDYAGSVVNARGAALEGYVP